MPKSSSYLRYTGLVFQMAAIIGVGVLIGMKLDSLFPNDKRLFTALFTLVFVVISMFIGIKDIMKG